MIIMIFSMKTRKPVNPLEGNLFTNMIRFVLPVMGVSLLTTLFSVADTAVIGRFGHAGAVSAIGATAAVSSLISGSLTAMSAGVTALAGNLFGAKEKEKIHDLLHVIPLTLGLLSALLACITLLGTDQIFAWINCPSEIFSDAKLYFTIDFLSLPFTAVYVFLSSIVQASGDTWHPLVFELSAAAANVAGNLVFVILFDLNILGVAAATYLSRLLACILILHFLMHRTGDLKLSVKEMKLFKGTKELWKMGIPSSLDYIAMSMTSVVISAFMNTFSPDVIAGNTIGQSLESMVVICFTGFSGAGAVFVSQNNGAGNRKRVMESFLLSMSAAFLLAEGAGILVYLFRRPLLMIFTSSEAIMESASLRLFWMCLFFGLCGTMNVIGGCIRGLKDAKSPVYLSIVCSVFFRLSWLYFIAIPKNSPALAYACFPAAWAMFTLAGIVVFMRDYGKTAAAVQE